VEKVREGRREKPAPGSQNVQASAASFVHKSIAVGSRCKRQILPISGRQASFLIADGPEVL
jgi:hypothetical protein